MTETAPDGTETVTEIKTSADGTVTVEEAQSLFEEVVEAVFDGDSDSGEMGTADSSGDVSGEVEVIESEGGSELESGTADFTIGGQMVAPDVLSAADVETAGAPIDSAFVSPEPIYVAPATSDLASDSSVEAAEAGAQAEAAAEAAEQQGHVDGATEAQGAADEFIASGDYEAAAAAREVAENKASEAGTDSMLSAYDSSDFAVSAEKQDDAEYYSAQEAMHAQQGDYEAAREDAGNAAYATYEADSSAGGADHTGQADAEHYEMDWAVHEEKQADYYAASAVDALEDGNLDQAEMYAAQADTHQASADHYGDLGEHGGDMAVYDPSSEVAAGGTYESSFDSSAVDTGYDAGASASIDSGYDSTTDDV